MKRKLIFVLAGTLLLSACGAHKSDSIKASNYWVRSALRGGNGAAYMLLTNDTGQADQLIGASSDTATAVEIHFSQMEPDGVMQMIHQQSVAIDSGAELELKPGSYNAMLIGLKQDLNVGDHITLTLHFNSHTDITLTAPAQDTADMDGSGLDGHEPMP